MRPDHPIPQPNYAVYESRKAVWIDTHPGATPAEYQAAVAEIARECGV